MFKEFEEFMPKDFLNLAAEMYKNIDTYETNISATKRNIYGRIYYATFLFVREWLENNTKYVSFPHGEHTRLPNFIKNKGPFDKEQNAEIYRLITNLKRLRHQSDYYLKIPNKYSQIYQDWVFDDINKAFKNANYIIQCFNEYENH